jgi:thiol-disulfide isomerase/thioredoxin
MHAITIGPLVLAPDRFAALLAVSMFVLIATLLARRIDPRLEAWANVAAFGGLVAARIGHVLLRWTSFAEEPWRIFAVWQGGFNVPSGLVAVTLATALYARTIRVAAGAVAALSAAGLVGVVTLELTKASFGQAAPVTRMTTLDCGFRSIRDFEDRPVVINLWATWCPPCRRELPMMARMAAERQDVPFLFINQGKSADKVRSYLSTARIDLRHVLLDAAMAVSRHYAAPGLPVTLYLRQDGTLASLHTGEISREALAAGIDGITGATQ